MTVHLFIPDTQSRPGTPSDHLTWIGKFIVEKKPDVIVHAGDHFDMPSLSSYDKRGSKSMEGRRYEADVEKGNADFALLDAPTQQYNRRHRLNPYTPRKVLMRGNHEYRIIRAVEDNPQLEGVIGYRHLLSPGWEVHDFLKPVWIDGVAYCHFFANPMTGKPYGGMVRTRLNTIGHSFTQGHTQTLDMANRPVLGADGPTLQYGLVAGACFTPDHKVLTADLRYVELGSIQAGDQLVSFDETVAMSERRGRAYKTGTVLATRHREAEVFGVTLSNGKTFKVTGDHRWLVRVGGQTSMKEHGTYQWRATSGLRRGTLVPQPLPEWSEDRSYEAGYLSGIYDGEGCYYTRETSGGFVGVLTLAQKPGAVLDKTIALLQDICGVDGLGHQNQKGCVSVRIKGGTQNAARVLGQLRPVRLLPKFKPEQLGQMTSSINHKVVEIAPLGIQTIVEIDIDAKTMIVEGTPQHNCYLHDEDYKGYQGNAHWRGIVVKHEVRDGAYDIMPVSLNFLCIKYEGVDLKTFMAANYPEISQ